MYRDKNCGKSDPIFKGDHVDVIFERESNFVPPQQYPVLAPSDSQLWSEEGQVSDSDTRQQLHQSLPP